MLDLGEWLLLDAKKSLSSAVYMSPVQCTVYSVQCTVYRPHHHQVIAILCLLNLSNFFGCACPKQQGVD